MTERLHLNIGDTVYRIGRARGKKPRIITETVTSFPRPFAIELTSIIEHFNAFGTRLFLTREDAEKALGDKE